MKFVYYSCSCLKQFVYSFLDDRIRIKSKRYPINKYSLSSVQSLKTLSKFIQLNPSKNQNHLNDNCPTFSKHPLNIFNNQFATSENRELNARKNSCTIVQIRLDRGGKRTKGWNAVNRALCFPRHRLSRESVLPFKLILYFYPLFHRCTVGISRLIYMLSAVSESSRLGAESLFHTYCLIELRTSLALECKSPELNLDELRRVRVGGMGERGTERGTVCVYVCVWERERLKNGSFELPSAGSLWKKGNSNILCKRNFMQVWRTSRLYVIHAGKYVLRMWIDNVTRF